MKAELSDATSFDMLDRARKAEADGNLEEAAGLYETITKTDKADEFPYDRLMVIYRKLKEYKKELQVINRGIKLFENYYKKPALRNKDKQQKVATLSDAFIKSAGLKDKKGNLLYTPEPIARWMKRKVVVQNKIK